MIRLVDMRNYKRVKGEELIRIDRGNKILDNKFIMNNEDERDEVCDLYDKWFNSQIRENNPKVLGCLNLILDKSKDSEIALGCWCDNKRCHGETILKYLNSILIHGQQNDRE